MRTIEQKRFGALISGGSLAPYDQPLLDRGDWLVAPTLGAIVPGWLLAIPRGPTLSFRDWSATSKHSAGSVLHEITSHLKIRRDEIIWFEHGPSTTGTAVGCGLDHAHLHILIRPTFGFELFAEQVRVHSDLEWAEVAPEEVYSGLGQASSYLVAGSGDRAIRATEVEAIGSQFFRRVVAKITGDTAPWDYRNSPNMPNIQKTITVFRQLEAPE